MKNYNGTAVADLLHAVADETMIWVKFVSPLVRRRFLVLGFVSGFPSSPVAMGKVGLCRIITTKQSKNFIFDFGIIH